MKSGTNSLLHGAAMRGAIAALLLVGASTATTSCAAPTSREDLNTQGPPMIRQVMLTEQLSTTDIRPGQLAFGSHAASFFEFDDGEVISAVPLGSQEIRVVLDELVRGNDLEEIGCRDGSYSHIPYDTTPDDIARCAGSTDSLKDCTTVCLNPADGTPLGIRDEDGDGAPDVLRMIDYNDDPNVVELAVSITCDGVNIPLDQANSFWSPSGNQTFPSNETLSFRGLGPVIVLKPLGDKGLRTGAKCSVSFRPEVVDYDGNKVCAPTGGDITGDCPDGDTSKISFGTDAFRVVNTLPLDAASAVGVTESGFMIVALNAYVDTDTVATGITVTANGVDAPIVPVDTAGFVGDDKTLITFKLADDFLPDSTYAMTITTGLKDALGGSLPAEQVMTWTTEGLSLVSSSVASGATSVPFGPIDLDFNGVILASSFSAITLTKNGTPSSDGTPATDGTAVSIAPTLKSGDSSIVQVDLDSVFEINTYYELAITSAITGREGGHIAQDQLITFTTSGFAFRDSTPGEGATNVAIVGGNITLKFNADIDPATVSSISLKEGTNTVVITPIVQTDAREILINVGTSFVAGATYELTVGTNLKEIGGSTLGADTVISWTTAN